MYLHGEQNKLNQVLQHVMRTVTCSSHRAQLQSSNAGATLIQNMQKDMLALPFGFLVSTEVENSNVLIAPCSTSVLSIAGAALIQNMQRGKIKGLFKERFGCPTLHRSPWSENKFFDVIIFHLKYASKFVSNNL